MTPLSPTFVAFLAGKNNRPTDEFGPGATASITNVQAGWETPPGQPGYWEEDIFVTWQVTVSGIDVNLPITYKVYFRAGVPYFTNNSEHQAVPDYKNPANLPFATAEDPLFYDTSGNLLGELSPQPIPFSNLLSALATPGGIYAYQVSLLNGDDQITVQTGNEDPIEVGAGGTATIVGGASTSLWIWHDKNIVWTTTSADNALVFDAEAGSNSAPSGELFLNLITGTGSNPWGGTLSFQSVDQVAVGNILGTEYIICNNDGDAINSGFGSLQFAGDALIVGGTGNDTLAGANASGSPVVNVLVAGSGADALTGGASVDAATVTNVFSYNFGSDTITNFRAGAGSGDTIDLSAVPTVSSFSQVQALMSEVGANTVIDFAAGETITLDGLSAGNLTSSNFLFAPDAAFAFTQPGFAPPAAFAYTQPREADTGDTVQIYLAITGAFTVSTSNGSPTLDFTDGTSATYDSATTSPTGRVLVFDYTVSAGNHDPDLTIENVVSGGAVIADGKGDAVNFAPVSGEALGLQINPSPLYVASVTVASGGSAVSSGAEVDSGGTVTITLGMSESGFTVNTASGTPYLALDDGGTAAYAGSSGSDLDFSYTVQSGDHSPDLTIAGVGLGAEGAPLGTPGATIVDAGGYVADFSNALVGTGVQIGPTLYASSVEAALYDSSMDSGLLNAPISGFVDVSEVDAGATVEVIVNLNESVTVTGSPTLTLNDGGTASYDSALSDPGSGMLVFDHAVASADHSPNLAITAISGGSIVNQNNTSANFTNIDLLSTGVQIGSSPLTVESVKASTSGHVGSGQDVFLTLQMSEAVSVGNFGETELGLNDGEVAGYDSTVSDPTTGKLVFEERVGLINSDANAASLEITGLSLGSIQDAADYNANLSGAVNVPLGVQVGDPLYITSIGTTWPTPEADAGATVEISLDMSEAVTVNTAHGAPTLTLNDSATATYDKAASNLGAGKIIFDYKVGANDSTPFLDVASVNLNGAVIEDSKNNKADITLPDDTSVSVPNTFTLFPLQIGPVTVDTVETSQIGTVQDGQALLIEINFANGLTLDTTSGSPTLTLNDGATATLDSGMTSGGTALGSLIFDYSVGTADYTPDLAITSVSLNGASIQDLNDVNVDFAGALNNPTGVQIVTQIVSGGDTLVVSAGQSSGGVDLSGGRADVLSGGTADVTFVSAGGSAIVSGAGTASATNIFTGGSENVLAGGKDFGAQIFAGGEQDVFGVASGATVFTGGSQVVESGGTANSTTVSSGGMLELLDGGAASAFSIESGATLRLGSGTTLTGYQVGGGATVNVAAGASGSGIAISSGGTLTVLAGGAADSTTISSFGSQVVNAGGTAIGIVINGGTAQLADGAVVSGPIVFNNYDDQEIGTLAVGDFASAFLSGLSISDLGEGGLRDAIDLTNVTWSTGAKATISGGFLNVSVGGSTYDIGLGNPNAIPGATVVVEDDGSGGTLVIVAGPVISPRVSAISATPTSGGTVGLGETVEIDLDFTAPVSANGAPTLKLSDGGTAFYNTSGSNPASGILEFDYTVSSGQHTTDLTVTGITVPSGGSIKGLANEAANLTLTATEENLHLVVNGIPPVALSATAVPSSGGAIGGGGSAVITLKLSEAATVSGAPVLDLNDGGSATFTSAPTTSTLVFTYVAGAEITTDLTITGISETGGTITDAAGNELSTTLTSALKIAVNIDSWAHGSSGNFSSGADWTLGAPPMSGQDASLTVAGAYTVSVGSGANDAVAALNIGDKTATLLVTSGGTLSATSGTGAGANSGTIDVGDGATLVLGGVLNNSGTINLQAGNDGATLKIENGSGPGSGITLSGGGKVVLANSPANVIDSDLVLAGSSTLTNVNNTIAGAGTIGNGTFALINDSKGVIDADGADALTVTTPSAVLQNAGLLEATSTGGLTLLSNTVSNSPSGSIAASGSGATVILDVDNILGGTLKTSGKNAAIEVTAASDISGGTIAGGSLVEVTSGALLTLTGVTMVSSGATVSVTSGSTAIVSGPATIGKGGSVVVGSGSTAIVSGGATNSGTLYASGTGGLLQISGAVTGGGVAEIGNGIVNIQSSAENVTFASGGSGQLQILDTSGDTSDYSGKISGFGKNVAQSIDIVSASVTSGANVSATYSLSYTSANSTSGTLVVTSGGTANVIADITLIGSYKTANFALKTDFASGGATTGTLEIVDPPVEVHSANVWLFGQHIAAGFVTPPGSVAGPVIGETWASNGQPLSLAHPHG
jgi:autotransporter passenger strand-loop-strand repeat protein